MVQQFKGSNIPADNFEAMLQLLGIGAVSIVAPIVVSPTAYVLGNVAGEPDAAVTHSINVIRMLPFAPSPFFKRMIRLKINVTVAGGAGSLTRLGIYSDIVDTTGTHLPGTLLFDSGDIDTNGTGVKQGAVAPSIVYTPGQLLWAALISGVGAPTLSSYTSAKCIQPVAGYDSATLTTANTVYQAALAFGALPNTVPTLSGINISVPAIWVSYAS